MGAPAYREHELAFRTQYAVLKERTLAGSVRKHPALEDALRECLGG